MVSTPIWKPFYSSKVQFFLEFFFKKKKSDPNEGVSGGSFIVLIVWFICFDSIYLFLNEMNVEDGIRLIGVRLDKLVDNSNYQTSLLDFCSTC